MEQSETCRSKLRTEAAKTLRDLSAVRHFPFVFDLLLLDFFVADLGVLFVSPDFEGAGVVADGVGGVVVPGVDGEEMEAGAPRGGITAVVEVGVPVGVAGAVVVAPSAAGVVGGVSGFLNGSSQVCRT